MNDPNLKTGWDTALFVAPMLALLFMSIFRLDTVYSASRRRPASGGQMRFSEPDVPLTFSDPDGRPWRQVLSPAQVRQSEENLNRMPRTQWGSPCRRIRRPLIR